jgi:hypothetical protein
VSIDQLRERYAGGMVEVVSEEVSVVGHDQLTPSTR